MIVKFMKQKYHHIKAHENTIEIIEINFTGTKFSSASDKGTIIRIFNIKDDTLIHEFRRGTEQAIIYNISFDLNDTLLVVSSNRPTVHLFALIDKNNPNKGNKDIQNSKSMFNGISKILGVGKILQNELINANNILSFLKENFNELTGCIPLINRIEKRIANNELLVIEEDFTRKTIGLLEYSSENKITIKHLAVSKEYRGKGIAKYLLNTLSSQNKPIITWTTSGSDAEKIYRNNGFMRTTYKSVVLLFEGE